MIKRCLFLRAGIILLIFFGTASIAHAVSDDNGGYIVTPAIGPVEDGVNVKDTGADKNITFWDLPLWIQLSVISGATISVFSFAKYLPLLLGKIFTKDTNPKLEEIVSYIAENPGCLESEIANKLDLNRSTLRYYIARLSSSKRIHTIKKGKIKGIFHITYAESEEQKLLDLHKRNKTREKIIQIITKSPGITGQELSSELDLAKSTIHWHVTELADDDLVQAEKDGRFKRYYFQVDKKD